MTVKEVLVQELMDNGYGFITACEYAHEYLQEFRNSKVETKIVHVGNKSFLLSKKSKVAYG